MPSNTPYHGWTAQEPGDPDYAEIFARLVHAIDHDAIRKGTFDERPIARLEGRWYLASDGAGDGGEPAIYYDTGQVWQPVVADVELPPEVARVDRSEEIGSTWTFTQPIEANITGEASHAAEADRAELADNAERLNDRSADEYARADEDETISGEYTHEGNVVYQGGVDIEGGVLHLPQVSSTPPASERQLGSMWFNVSDQPSS